MTSADSDIVRNVFNCDWIGVIGGNIGNRSLHIAAGGVQLVAAACIFHEKRKCLVEAAGHFHGVHKAVPAGIVNAEQVFFDGICHGTRRNYRMRFGKISRF